MEQRRRVLEIIRMTNHNGPGFRTLVLFKGCPLRCFWCSTPESQESGPELGFFHRSCSLCGSCIPACPEKALSIKDGMLRIDREHCIVCGRCVSACAWKALKYYGKEMSAGEIMDVIRRDRKLFANSGGGATFSGGEPFFGDAEFLSELFRRCHTEGISVGVQTCGFTAPGKLENLMRDIDFFLWDLKVMDPVQHKEMTGAPNRQILDNLRRVSEAGIPVYLRVPIIPGFTDSSDNILCMAEFVQNLSSVKRVDLLPIHHLGKARYESLDRPYPIENTPYVDTDRMDRLIRIFSEHGIECGKIG